MSHSNLGGCARRRSSIRIGLVVGGSAGCRGGGCRYRNGDETSVSADSSAVGGSAKAGRVRPGRTPGRPGGQRTVTQDREGRVGWPCRLNRDRVSASGRCRRAGMVAPSQFCPGSPLRHQQPGWSLRVQPEIATTGGVSAAVRTRARRTMRWSRSQTRSRTASETFFNRLANSLNDLPVNDVTTNYLGAPC